MIQLVPSVILSITMFHCVSPCPEVRFIFIFASNKRNFHMLRYR